MTRGVVATIVLATSSWAIAALLVAQCQRFTDEVSPIVCAASKVIAIAAVAFVYARLLRHVTLDRALATGFAWIALSIVTEVVVASYVGHGWYRLLGSPAHEGPRTLVMIAWVAAPAVFANARDEK